MNNQIKKIFLLLVLFISVISIHAMDLDVMAGYSLPVNASYVDTYENQDIYWNPNSGLNFDFRMNYKLSDRVRLSIPIDLVVGFYRYDTTDGRKVNTEAQAGNTPQTVNTEWSWSPNIVPTVYVRTGDSFKAPDIGIGFGIGYLRSYETWSFTNNDGNDALLFIEKFYWPSPLFRGEISWNIPSKKKNRDIKVSAVFNMVNYAMRRVLLNHYYVNGADTIDQFDVQDTVYSYGYNVPDENKGGDCLLAGFAYQNYPQQKISSNFTLKIGFSYSL